MVRHVIYYLFLCVCMRLSCTQKCPKGLTRDLFFPPGYNGSTSGLWPRFHVFAVGVLCGFFHMTSLSCGFPCTFTQVKFSFWLMYRTLVTPASFSLHLRSEKDLCKSLSAFIYPCILHSSGGWCWWDLYWLLGSSHAQSCQINFVNFLTGTTFLVSLYCLQSAEEHAARTCVG